MTGYEIELHRQGQSTTLTPDDYITFTFPNSHSSIDEFTLTLPPNTDWEWWAEKEGADLLAFRLEDGTRASSSPDYRGIVDNCETPMEAGEPTDSTTLTGQDATAYLRREGGADVRYQDTLGYEAIQSYINNHVSGFDWTVLTPSEELVGDNELVQSAQTDDEFPDVFGTDFSADTAPIIGTDTRKLAQSCFTTEGENYDRSELLGSNSDVSYSNGEAPELDFDSNTFSDSVPAYTEYDFTLNYTIPGDDFEVAIREEGSSDGTPAVRILLNHADGTTYTVATRGQTGGIVHDWNHVRNNDSGWSYGEDIPDLTAGDYTLRCEVTDSGGEQSTAKWRIDVVAPYDSRWNFTFDNQVHADNGYLDGPGYYAPYEAESEVVAIGSDIVQANLNVVFDVTHSDCRLQVSHDGTDWRPSDGSETGTDQIDVNYSNTGTGVMRGRVRIAPWGQRDTATPRRRYNRNDLRSWELRLDYTDTVVFTDRRYTGGDFENLKTMHEDAGLVFAVEASDIDTPIPASTLKPSDWEKSAEWIEMSHTRKVESRGYANVQRAYGPRRDDGTRLEVTVEATDEINAVGEVPAEPIVRPQLDNELDLKSEARTALLNRLNNSDVVIGTIKTIPEYMVPGYVYSAPEYNGETRILREVVIRSGVDGPVGQLKFEDSDDFQRVVTSIQTKVQTTTNIL